MVFTYNINKKDIKSFDQLKVNHGNIQNMAIDYFSTNGFKLNRQRKIISILDAQIKSKLKRIIIKRSFFNQNKSLLSELMDLSYKQRSIVLKAAFQTVFKIGLVDKEVIILK